MALHYSVYEMSDDEGDHGRGISYEDDEPQAIEEIVEGEVEPFNTGEEAGDDDLDGLFGDANAPAADAEKKEVKERKARKKSDIPRMNADRLKGPSGIIALDEIFKDFKMRGRGREEEDLEHILKRMQTWTHRMYPRFAFPDCIDQIERVGNKMMIKSFMLRNRNQPIPPDVTPVRLFDDDDDDEDEAAVDEPAAVGPASPRRGYDSDGPASVSPPPPALPADLLERMRQNREAALRRRAEKMREREAAANGGSLADNGMVANGWSVPVNGTNGNDDSTPVNGIIANGTNGNDDSTAVNGIIANGSSVPMNGNASAPVNDITLPSDETATNGFSSPSKVTTSSVSNTTNNDSSDSETPMDVDEPDRPLSR